MDMKKIATDVRQAEELLERIAADAGELTVAQKVQLWKRATQNLSDAKAQMDHAAVRSEDQTFIRECVMEKIEQITKTAHNVPF